MKRAGEQNLLFPARFFYEKRLDVFHKIGCDCLRSNKTVMTVLLGAYVGR